MNNSEPDRPRKSSCYEIRLQGRLDQRWSTWFDGLILSTDEAGTTTLRGPVTDQAALHGLLARVRDLGVPLISLRRLENDACEPTTPSRSQP